MLTANSIREQLPLALGETNLPLPGKHSGKVRDWYDLRQRPPLARHHRSVVGVRSDSGARAVQGSGAESTGGVVVRSDRAT